MEYGICHGVFCKADRGPVEDCSAPRVDTGTDGTAATKLILPFSFVMSEIHLVFLAG